MSDSEGEASYFGTPLEPYDEDAFPKKRPIAVEEQVARDVQGRRRFHGAFTGGFSAGFYNTVGSLEGWSPAEFKSSRSDKAHNKQQRPEDYMDDEDIGEFGIAPQTVRATDDYSTSGKKRKKKVFADGPIPGQPVLETLIQAGNETVGYFLMKNMNYKRKPSEADKSTGLKVYSCAMPKNLPAEPDEVPQYHLHESYKQYLVAPKINTFGLGYVGLDKTHLNLFQPAKLKVRERNNKKLSISGQAFGVGAFEEDDEDIYVKEDMSRYDFELTAEERKNKVSPEKAAVLDIFVLSKNSLIPQNNFPPPVIPTSFTGKHNVKRSRFEPVPDPELPDRRNINASVRSTYLGENNSNKTYTPSNQQHKQASTNNKNKNPTPVEIKTEKKEQPAASSSDLLFDRFVSAKLDDDPTNILEPVKRTETTHGTKEMHGAVKLKMFGPLTRVTLSWQPCSALCKRFNVPEPRFEELKAQKNKKRTKNLIFEYQKHKEIDPLHKSGLSTQAVVESNQNDNEATSSTQVIEIKTERTFDDKPKTSSDTQNACTSQESNESPVTLNNTTNPNEKVEEEIKNNRIIDLTDRVDVSKNTDLFKAVFLSSSESESEDEVVEENEDKQRKELIAATVVSEPLIPKIKPTKEGILSNIDFSKFSSTQRNVDKGTIELKDDDTENTKAADDNNLYGPKLPQIVVTANTTVVNETSNIKSDKWVEKDFLEKQKKHKKHKKEKIKQKHKKKHKHKSKR